MQIFSSSYLWAFGGGELIVMNLLFYFFKDNEPINYKSCSTS